MIWKLLMVAQKSWRALNVRISAHRRRPFQTIVDGVSG
jgi:hypothetical protein